MKKKIMLKTSKMPAYDRAKKRGVEPSEKAREHRPQKPRANVGKVIDELRQRYHELELESVSVIHIEGSRNPRSVYLVDVIDTLDFCNGLIGHAARLLRVPFHMLRAKINEDSREGDILRQAMRSIQESILDDAEMAVIEGLQRREQWALKYYLDAKGKARGFGKAPEEMSVPRDIKIQGDFPSEEYA